jgi:hypothetical protein
MSRRRTRKTNRLRFERLEPRACPAVDVFQRGNTLFIAGDVEDDWVAVCDEGGHVVEVQTIEGTEFFRGIRSVIANLGEGSDTFEFHQAATGPNGNLNVAVDLAAGDDDFLYQAPPEPDQPPPDPDRRSTYRINVRAGLGNDVMIVGPEYLPGLGLDFRAQLGDGADVFQFLQGERPMESLSLSADLAAGSDRFEYRPPPGDLAPPEPDRPATNFFDIHSGIGDDVVVIQPCVVPGLDLSVRADLGDGDDLFDAAFEGPAASAAGILPGIALDVAAGEGDDLFRVAIGNPDVMEALALSDLHVGVRGFGGDDSGILSYADLTVERGFTQRLDLGDGDDVASSTLDNVAVDGQLQMSAIGGIGSDDIGYIIDGGKVGSLSQTINTGDGDDTIIVFDRMTASGAVSSRLDTGGGDDSASVMIEDSQEHTAFAGPFAMHVLLGAGDDLGNVVLRDANDFGGPLTVKVAGGTGDDGIVADVDFTPRVRAGQLDPGNAPVSALIDLRGGAGSDTLDAYTEGVWSGLARFILRGGDDDDDIGFHGVIGAGNTGALAVAVGGGTGDDVMVSDFVLGPEPHICPILFHMLGGTGDDLLFLNFLGGPDTTPEPHLYVLDGGPGFDRARAPTGAVVRNCEGRI